MARNVAIFADYYDVLYASTDVPTITRVLVSKPTIQHQQSDFFYYFREGSIQADYNLYFSAAASVNGSIVNDDLQKYLTDKGCVDSGPDCDLGDLTGVDITRSEAQGNYGNQWLISYLYILQFK